MPRRRDLIKQAVDSVTPITHRWYENHFTSLDNTNRTDVFHAFMFSALTVHMKWESTVRMYTDLRDADWDNFTIESLTETIKGFRVGLHNGIAKRLWSVYRFFRDEEEIYKKEDEDWVGYRSRLSKRIHGLSYTKISFPIEMLWPEANVVCLDTHMLGKVFNHKRGKYGHYVNLTTYKKFENEWCRACTRAGKKPGLVRLAYWDSLMGYDSAEFWTDCLFVNRRELHGQCQEDKNNKAGYPAYSVQFA